MTLAPRDHDAQDHGAEGAVNPAGPPGRGPYGAVPWTLTTFERRRAAYLMSARRILDCPAQAEDVVQDVMLRLVADPPQAGDGLQAAYVERMVRNLTLDRARRQSLKRRLFRGLYAAPDSFKSGEEAAKAAASSRESLRQVEAALAELPEPVRTALRLHQGLHRVPGGLRVRARSRTRRGGGKPAS